MSFQNVAAIETERLKTAFIRHPRPQQPKIPAVPTKTALALKAHEGSLVRRRTHANMSSNHDHSRKTQNSDLSLWCAPMQQQSPWEGKIRLGTLLQGKERLVVCVSRGKGSELIMVKQLGEAEGNNVRRILREVSHPNIVELKQAFWYNESIYLEFAYCRITLAQILFIHVPLDEGHLQVIASSVFDAIKHIAKAGYTHGQINLQAIRLCGREGTAANFEHAHQIGRDPFPNSDLESLGLVLLDCMNRRAYFSPNRLEYVMAQRAQNKVFGLHDSERWSGSKQLIDFLDELFNQKKSASAKLENSHAFVTTVSAEEALWSLAEMVSLECFERWIPGYTDLD